MPAVKDTGAANVAVHHCSPVKVTSRVVATQAPGDRGLIVDVTTNFAPGEYISISGLGFTGFTAAALFDNLELDVKNAVDTDDKTIRVNEVADVPFFTATATDSQVKLEWVTPDDGTCVEVLIVRDLGSNPTPGSFDWSATVACPGPGIKQSTTNFSPLNDSTYTYGAFVHDGIGNYSPLPGQLLDARPFDTTGNVKWAYSTGAASMASPGLRFSGGATVYAVSNDNILHAIQGGAGFDGGTWPVGMDAAPTRRSGSGEATGRGVRRRLGDKRSRVSRLPRWQRLRDQRRQRFGNVE